MPSTDVKAHGAPATSRHSKISPEDQRDLDAIHASIDRMKKITPPDPYILTIPQEVEPRYHHYRNQQWQWLDHAPFHPREGESIQYQTFHFYDHGEDMYVLHNSRLIDSSREEEEARTNSRTQTAGNTPNGAAPKKKITLDAYKKKQAGTPVPDSHGKRGGEPPRSQPSLPDQRSSSELKRKRDVDQSDLVARERTPTRERGTDAKTSKAADVSNRRQEATRSSPKSLRKSPERRNASRDEATSLPPKLSPLGVPSLPDRLSPTIPPNIKATLNERERSAKKSGSGSARDHRTSPTKNALEHSQTKESSQATANAASRSTTSPELSQSDEIQAIRRGARKPKSTPEIVTLKYKKKLSNAISRILNLPPRPSRGLSPSAGASKESTESDEEPLAAKVSSTVRSRDASDKGVASKLGPARSGVSEKRPAPDPGTELERSAKRQRQLAETKSHSREPSTPVQADVNSPTVQSSTQRAEQVTPTIRKNLLSASKPGKHANSPTVDSSTPAVASQSNGNLGNGVTRPASSQSSKTPMQNAWEQEQKTLDALGRELKHAATADLNSAQSEQTRDKMQQKLAAVKSIESLLSYILAFTCSDQGALAADPKQHPPIQPWRSLRGFYGFVRKNCEPFPLLCGLACWLGAVSFAHTLTISSQNPTEGPSRDTLLDFNTLMHRAAVQGEAKLDLDNLMDNFPRTWRQREKGAVSGTLQGPKKLSGKFKLPIGVQTPPFQAARAGYAMLEEWITNEDIGYSLKLKL